MEEFKIITLPIKKEDNQDNDQDTAIEEDIKVEDPEGYEPPRKRFIIIPFIILILIIGAVVYNLLVSYTDYETCGQWERTDSTNTEYDVFNNNLIKYSQDGIFYTSYTGDSIWSYGYDMTNPVIKTCGNYLVVFDKKGTEANLFNTKGFIKNISCTIPIYDADVSSIGTVALLLEDNNTSYIKMYDSNGSTLASGEIHPENSGYPLSMAISSDGTKIVMSLLNINDGNIKTNVVFYDFSSQGRKQEDNIAASYSYLDALIPTVDFVAGDKAIALGDNEIIIYNNNYEDTVEKEIYFSDEINSLAYNDSYIAFISNSSNEEGQSIQLLNVYNLFGFKCTSKEIETEYLDFQIMNNNEIVFLNGQEVTLFNVYGFEKFNYSFSAEPFYIVPGETSHRYYVLTQNQTEEIRLR